jgi:hypothetical protein
MQRYRSLPLVARALLLTICSVSVGVICFAQTKQRSEGNAAPQEELLRRFLQEYDKASFPEVDRKTTYVFADIDLNGDGIPESIVHLESSGWCGSGGCVTLILKRKGGSFEIVSHMTISRLPIRVLTNRTNGWRDITVWVAGGGIQPGYEAQLRYDGKAYPGNPSVPPARRLEGKAEGETVISSSQPDKLVYP